MTYFVGSLFACVCSPSRDTDQNLFAAHFNALVLRAQPLKAIVRSAICGNLIHRRNYLSLGRICVLSFLVQAGWPATLLAVWPTDPYENVPVVAALGDQNLWTLISDGSGGVIVCWTDSRIAGNADIYAQRIASDGTVQWNSNGIPLCSATGPQVSPAMAPDGYGGAFVAWTDSRIAGNQDVYMQHLHSDGSTSWASNGVPLCAASGNQTSSRLLADGAGGFIAAWTDSRSSSTVADVYVQRVSSSGEPQWNANGNPVCTAPNAQTGVSIVSDGAGGAILAWEDYRANAWHIYSQRVLANGASNWSSNGKLVCSASIYCFRPVMIPDGAGGAIVTWFDQRSPGWMSFAQRISSAGTMRWTANGVSLCSEVGIGGQTYPVIAPDGHGGAIIAWKDMRSGIDDIYAQRISASGAIQWPATGAIVCGQSSFQSAPDIIPDGTGGAIVVWQDLRNSPYDIFAQQIRADGSLAWNVDGVAVCVHSGQQRTPRVVSDGQSGAIVVWDDLRGGDNDIYAQRVPFMEADFAQLAITDVPGDQGGMVAATWLAHAADSFSSAAPIAEYELQRLSDAWQTVAQVAARTSGAYSTVVATPDILVSGQPAPAAQYRIVARTIAPVSVYISAVANGYSIDNVPPAAPDLMLSDTETSRVLVWQSDDVPDVGETCLYRDMQPGFDAGISVVCSSSLPYYVEDHLARYYYRARTFDIHGNGSEWSNEVVGQWPTPVPSALPASIQLHPCQPNPFNPRTTLRYDLPGHGSVRLSIFDLAGRLVCTLVDESRSRGSYVATWDGRDASGNDVGSGTYLGRLEFGGSVEVQRLVLVR